jgi:hypothetical protein
MILLLEGKMKIKEKLDLALTYFEDGAVNTAIGVLKDIIENVEALRKEK